MKEIVVEDSNSRSKTVGEINEIEVNDTKVGFFKKIQTD